MTADEKQHPFVGDCFVWLEKAAHASVLRSLIMLPDLHQQCQSKCIHVVWLRPDGFSLVWRLGQCMAIEAQGPIRAPIPLPGPSPKIKSA